MQVVTPVSTQRRRINSTLVAVRAHAEKVIVVPSVGTHNGAEKFVSSTQDEKSMFPVTVTRAESDMLTKLEFEKLISPPTSCRLSRLIVAKFGLEIKKNNHER